MFMLKGKVDINLIKKPASNSFSYHDMRGHPRTVLRPAIAFQHWRGAAFCQLPLSRRLCR